VEPGSLPPTYLPADQLLWLKSHLTHFTTPISLFTTSPRYDLDEKPTKNSHSLYIFLSPSLACLFYLLLYTPLPFRFSRFYLASLGRFILDLLASPNILTVGVGIFGVVPGLFSGGAS
jgi:hypothetical protein